MACSSSIPHTLLVQFGAGPNSHRDSKNRSGQYLELTPGAWRALLSRVGDGAFDLHQ
ncbi:MAG TPA: DUF397 domain-containing protein [Streptosporangiaceae bacterium]|nr:DUF397 domain-containing protein [Streptosporangiaceae bacterium]